MFGRFKSDTSIEGYITSKDIRENLVTIKHMANQSDVAKLEAMANLIENRKFNFKHFLGFMKIDAVFRRFTELQTDAAVSQEDLEIGMLQLGLPTIKGIMQRSRHGWDFRDKPL